MQLYLLRHGQAETQAPTDSQRPLTQVGRNQVADIAAQWGQEATAVNAIWVSPYLRTRQTLAVLQDHCKLTAPVLETEHLTPGAKPRTLLTQLEQRFQDADDAVVLMVTHLPLVADFASLLTATEIPFLQTAEMLKISLPWIHEGVGECQWRRLGTA